MWINIKIGTSSKKSVTYTVAQVRTIYLAMLFMWGSLKKKQETFTFWRQNIYKKEDLKNV